jgi:hypothetical protein
MQWTPIDAFVLDQLFGFQTANLLRENMIALASLRRIYPLGGSREVGLPQVASQQNIPSWLDIELDGTSLGGFTKQLRVECRVSNAAMSITPTLRNVTDASDAAAGAACSATAADYSGSNQKQTVTATLAAGVKKYRLTGTPSSTTHFAFVIGYLEIYADA